MTRFTKSLRPEKNSNLKRKVRKLSKPILLVVLGIFFVGAIGIYLFQINYIAATGFQIRDYEKQISELTYENEKIQMQIIEMKSMTDLSAKVAELNMEPVGQITYYDTSGQVVARK
ncbi:hypothetical protein HQ571_00960 [Candidatus Kuenenbacteria bacterium]|nr:hypothetical protein [Candidatus Kuenenbacteria bacterium]